MKRWNSPNMKNRLKPKGSSLRANLITTHNITYTGNSKSHVIYCEAMVEENLGIRKKRDWLYLTCGDATAVFSPTLSYGKQLKQLLGSSACKTELADEIYGRTMLTIFLCVHESCKTSPEINAVIKIKSPAFRVILYYKLCLSQSSN
uniref:Uncharacterized protein n=1 Tax=Sphaerodactylus townsendi TaxID=933632 RepID=A0ACB8EJX0_9SAUR